MHYAWKLLIKIFFNRLLITWINKVRGSASRIITWRKDWSPPNLLANYTINLWKIITVAHLYCHLVETIYFLKIYPLLFQRKSHEFSQLCAMTCAVSPASQLSRSCTCLWVLHTPVRPLLCAGRGADAEDPQRAKMAVRWVLPKWKLSRGHRDPFWHNLLEGSGRMG